jgi:hypothetical protein
MANGKQHDSAAPLSRRTLFRNAAALAGGLAVLIGSAMPALAKMAQAAAGYQATTKGDQNCAGCALFQAPGSCTLIDGAISPTGWCKFFSKRSGG